MRFPIIAIAVAELGGGISAPMRRRCWRG